MTEKGFDNVRREQRNKLVKPSSARIMMTIILINSNIANAIVAETTIIITKHTE